MSGDSSSVSTKGFDILLVEDSVADVRLVKEFLIQNRPNYRLHNVNTGEEAMAFLYQQGDFQSAPRPDLILMDLNMPTMDGREVLRVIKNDRNLRCVPVLVFSSSKAAPDISKIYDLNANCYIVKPATLDDFMRVMKAVEEFWLKTVALATQYEER